jgi:hypothetical protein
MHTHTHAHTHISIYTHVYTHACSYTHTHIHGGGVIQKMDYLGVSVLDGTQDDNFSVYICVCTSAAQRHTNAAADERGRISVDIFMCIE